MSSTIGNMTDGVSPEAGDKIAVARGGGNVRLDVSALGGGLQVLYRYDPAASLASQIETTPVAAATGTDGTLTQDNFTLDPYSDTIRSTHTSGTSGGWRMYRLLKDGVPLVLPTRYSMRCRMGAREIPDGATGDGDNAIPAIVPYMLDGDTDHFFMMSRQAGTEENVQTFAMNGESTVSTTSTRGFLSSSVFTLGPNNKFGQNVQVDVLSRALSATHDPAMEFQISSWHDSPTNFAINAQSGGIWTATGGASNDPDSAWDAGWNTDTPEIGAALMFYEFVGAAGFSQIGELEILTYDRAA